MECSPAALRLSAVVRAPFGAVGIATADAFITEIVFLPPGTPMRTPANPLAERAFRQIEHYLADPDAPFSLPLQSCGSAFRRRVWQAIAAIPRGETRRYGELARAVGSAARAVGQACGDNPFPLVIPCHRVIGADGPGGFAHDRGGYLLDIKRWLLAHEAPRPFPYHSP